METPATRFWRMVEKTDTCWNWTGALHNGYGWFNFNGRPQRASRVAWVLAYGFVPKDLCVLHACDNRRCIRLGHLFLGTIADNNEDKYIKGRNVDPPNGIANRAKTHCPRGHEYTEANTYYKPRKRGGASRMCRTCRYEQAPRNGKGKAWRKGLKFPRRVAHEVQT